MEDTKNGGQKFIHTDIQTQNVFNSGNYILFAKPKGSAHTSLEPKYDMNNLPPWPDPVMHCPCKCFAVWFCEVALGSNRCRGEKKHYNMLVVAELQKSSNVLGAQKRKSKISCVCA